MKNLQGISEIAKFEDLEDLVCRRVLVEMYEGLKRKKIVHKECKNKYTYL